MSYFLVAVNEVHEMNWKQTNKTHVWDTEVCNTCCLCRSRRCTRVAIAHVHRYTSTNTQAWTHLPTQRCILFEFDQFIKGMHSCQINKERESKAGHILSHMRVCYLQKTIPIYLDFYRRQSFFGMTLDEQHLPIVYESTLFVIKSENGSEHSWVLSVNSYRTTGNARRLL